MQDDMIRVIAFLATAQRLRDKAAGESQQATGHRTRRKRMNEAFLTLCDEGVLTRGGGTEARLAHRMEVVAERESTHAMNAVNLRQDARVEISAAMLLSREIVERNPDTFVHAETYVGPVSEWADVAPAAVNLKGLIP